jgi:hypothetical protein
MGTPLLDIHSAPQLSQQLLMLRLLRLPVNPLRRQYLLLLLRTLSFSPSLHSGMPDRYVRIFSTPVTCRAVRQAQQ